VRCYIKTEFHIGFFSRFYIMLSLKRQKENSHK